MLDDARFLTVVIDQEMAALLLKQMLKLHVIDLDRDSFFLSKPTIAAASKGYELHINAHLDLDGRLRMQQITAQYRLKIKETPEKIVVYGQ